MGSDDFISVRIGHKPSRNLVNINSHASQCVSLRLPYELYFTYIFRCIAIHDSILTATVPLTFPSQHWHAQAWGVQGYRSYYWCPGTIFSWPATRNPHTGSLFEDSSLTQNQVI